MTNRTEKCQGEGEQKKHNPLGLNRKTSVPRSLVDGKRFHEIIGTEAR